MKDRSLSIRVESQESGPAVLRLAGTIDEHSDLSRLHGLGPGPVVLDLAEVRRINSVGVREWIRAMRAIPEPVEVFWDNVSPAMVTQLGMIANFHGHSRIRSFYAPYYCPACDLEQRYLLSVSADLSDGQPVAPPRECPECTEPLVFDDIEEDYLGALLEVSGARAGRALA